jgi:thymidylate kinase
MQAFLITFSGIDGAGKSTQITKLADYLKVQHIAVRHFAFWDDVVLFRSARTGFSRRVLQSDGGVGTPERPARRNDKNTQSWPLLTGRAILHVFDVIHLRRVVRRALKENEGAAVIFDRYIYDQLAALPMDRWWVRAYAAVLLQIAPRPDLALLLDAIPEAARARKPEYPLEFMRKYRSSYLELRKLAGLEMIPAAEPEVVYLTILDRLHKFIDPQTLDRQVRSAVPA